MIHSVMESRRWIIMTVLVVIALLAAVSLKQSKLGLFPDVIKVSLSINYRLVNQDSSMFYHQQGKLIEKKLHHHKDIEQVLADYSMDSVNYFVKFKSGVEPEEAKQIAYNQFAAMNFDMQPHRFNIAISENDGSSFIFLMNNASELTTESLSRFKALLKSNGDIIKVGSPAFVTPEAQISIHHIPPKLALQYPSFVGNVINSLDGQALHNKTDSDSYDYLSSTTSYFDVAHENLSAIENRLLRSSVSMTIVSSKNGNKWYDKNGPIAIFEVSFTSDADPILIKKHIENAVYKTFNVSDVEFVLDPAQFVENAMESVQNSLLLASAFVFLILLLVTRSFVNSLIVSLCVCLISLFSIVLLMLFGFQLNLVVLSSLMISIGVGVDASIVVYNQIYRYSSYHSLALIKKPLIGSLLTNIIVFTPILFFEQYEVKAFSEVVFVFLLSCSLSFMLSYWLLPIILIKRRLNETNIEDSRLLVLLTGLLSTIARKSLIFYPLLVLVVVGTLCLYYRANPELTFFDEVSSGPVLMIFQSPDEESPDFHLDNVREALSQALPGEYNYRLSIQNDQFILLLPQGASPLADTIKSTIKAQLSANDLEISHRIWLPTDFKMSNPPEVVISFYDNVYENFDAFANTSLHLSEDPGLKGVFKAPNNVARTVGTIMPTPLAYAELDLGTIKTLESLAELIVSKKWVNQIQSGDDNIKVYTVPKSTTINDQNVVLKEQVLPLRYFIDEQFKEYPYFFWSKNGRKLASISIESVPNTNSAAEKMAFVQSRLQSHKLMGLDGHYQIENGHEEIHRTIKELVYAALLAAFLIYALTHLYFGSFRDAIVMMVALLICISVTLGLYMSFYSSVSIATGVGVILQIGLGINNFYLLYTRTQESHNIQLVLIERLMPLVLTNATTILCSIPLTMTTGIESILLRPIGITLIIGSLVFLIFSVTIFPGLIQRFSLKTASKEDASDKNSWGKNASDKNTSDNVFSYPQGQQEDKLVC